MTQQHRCQHDSISSSQDSAAPSPAGLGITISWLNIYIAPRPVVSAPPSPALLTSDITQQLDHQHQQDMTSAASRHVASSYWYYSPLCLVPEPMQASCYAAWHLRDAYTFWRFIFEDFKLWTPNLNSLKDLIRESEGTPNRCTYTVPLFDQIGEKALSNFMLEYLVPEIEYLTNSS
jgi:hypothetical protein